MDAYHPFRCPFVPETNWAYVVTDDNGNAVTNKHMLSISTAVAADDDDEEEELCDA